MQPFPLDDERTELPEEVDSADPSEKVPSAPELPEEVPSSSELISGNGGQFPAGPNIAN